MEVELVLYYILLGVTIALAVHANAYEREVYFLLARGQVREARSEQQFLQVRSPNPRVSRFCLAMVLFQCTALGASLFRLDYYAGEFSRCWITAVTLGMTAMLLVFHYDLRQYYERHSSLWTFGRALPLYAGFASVSTWVVLHAALSCNTISGTTGWFVIAQVWFWAGYWFEWWTRYLADKLECFGC